MAASMRTFLAGIALLGTAAGAAYTLFAIAQMRRFRASQPDAAPPAHAEGITVLKPLHGDEPLLYENLSSFCRQHYSEFQIIFGTADPHDSAVATARRVQRDHPGCDIEVVAGSDARANNPKIANLMGMLPHAKHPIVLIADSDIRVGCAYLQFVAAGFSDPRAGAVTCIYGGIPDTSLASQLGAMFVNETFSPSVLVARALEPLTYCFGATMAVRRNVLDQIGGLRALGEHLGDDYMLGNLVTRAGYSVVLSPYVVHTTVHERSLRSLWQRELRWGRTIRAARPAGYAGTLVTNLLPFAIAYAFLCRRPIAGIMAVTAAALSRATLHKEARKTFAPYTQANPSLIPVRDALTLGVWCATFLGRGVAWRGDRYSTTADGRMVGGTDECNISV